MRPRILMIADVKGWTFDNHCREITSRLSNKYEFYIGYANSWYFNEFDYDIVYPLEWNLARNIINRDKFMTGIRSHLSWDQLNMDSVCEFLKGSFKLVHVVSKRLYDIFSPRVPVHYTTHGVDAKFFKAEKPRGKSKGLYVGWAGNRQSRVKGFEQFIAPLDKIKDVHVQLCGFSDKKLSRKDMPGWYNSLDVYICSSSSEGNCNPLLEAAACFPFETLVEAQDVSVIHKHLYTGNLICIKTSNGMVEATPEHPFWTEEGWITARDLHPGTMVWYNSNTRKEGYYATEGVSKIFTGSIGEIAGTVFNDASYGSCQISWNDKGTGFLGTKNDGCKKNCWSKNDIQVSSPVRVRMGIYSWISRWRGIHFHQKTHFARPKLETNDYDYQYIGDIDGLVVQENKSSKFLGRDNHNEAWASKILSFLDKWNFISAVLHRTRKISNNKKPAVSSNCGMVKGKTFPGISQPNFRETKGHYSTSTNLEPQTVLEVRTRKVINLPVFNFTTKDGTYLANGYLVHNCGLPIITTDNGTVPEIFKDHESAIIVDRRQQAFVDAVQELRDNPSLRTRLGKNARAAIMNGWTWDQRVHGFEEMFEEMTA